MTPHSRRNVRNPDKNQPVGCLMETHAPPSSPFSGAQQNPGLHPFPTSVLPPPSSRSIFFAAARRCVLWRHDTAQPCVSDAPRSRVRRHAAARGCPQQPRQRQQPRQSHHSPPRHWSAARRARGRLAAGPLMLPTRGDARHRPGPHRGAGAQRCFQHREPRPPQGRRGRAQGRAEPRPPPHRGDRREGRPRAARRRGARADRVAGRVESVVGGGQRADRPAAEQKPAQAQAPQQDEAAADAPRPRVPVDESEK